MSIHPELQRLSLLYGDEAIERFQRARVIIFGVGGVGSWCAEALVRSGIGSITMVDADNVDPTNINRQLPATSLTVGQPKAEALARRLKEISPACRIDAIKAFYTAENANEFEIEGFDAVIDAIDSLPSKAALLLQASNLPSVKLFSSMGAARRVDPGMVKCAEFWKVKGCPLARALRDRFKRQATFPKRKFRCVYSDEPPKGEPKGTSMAVTATFGLRLAAEALNSLANTPTNTSL